MSGQVIYAWYLKQLSDAEIAEVLPLKDIRVEKARRDFAVGGECRMVRFTAWRKAYPNRRFYSKTKAGAIAELRCNDHNLALNILRQRNTESHEQTSDGQFILMPPKKVKWWRRWLLNIQWWWWGRKEAKAYIDAGPWDTGL